LLQVHLMALIPFWEERVRPSIWMRRTHCNYPGIDDGFVATTRIAH